MNATVNTTQREFLTPAEIASQLKVHRDKVVSWIHRGELKGVDVGNTPRPQYRVAKGELVKFLEARDARRRHGH